MTKLFKPLISLWRLWKKVKHPGFAYRLLPEIYTPDLDKLFNHKLNHESQPSIYNRYSSNQLSLFGKHGELLLRYLKSGNISFEKMNGENEIMLVLFNNNDIRLHVHNYDNLQVIEEVFINQVYDFQSLENYVVCDVGMNIGIASLYFASFENVEKVYGYEPFLQTFERARENLELNKELALKIETYNYGLGNKNEMLEVPKPADGFLGGSTSSGFIEMLPEELKKDNMQVEIKDICQSIKQLKQNHPGRKLILKLDCEGAEYDILEKLDAENMINDISVFMIEFHFKGKKTLQKTLLKNNYFIMSPVNDEINQFGMLYAIKQY
jgi:FkbM family methyltransferase